MNTRPRRNEEPASKIVNFRLTEAEHERARLACEALGTNMSDVCRTALEEAAERALELQAPLNIFDVDLLRLIAAEPRKCPSALDEDSCARLVAHGLAKKSDDGVYHATPEGQARCKRSA